MINPVSTADRKAAKRRIRKALRDHKITMQEVKDRSGNFHYNTVRDAFNHETKYWNQEIIDLAVGMIEEKKNPVPQEQSL